MTPIVPLADLVAELRAMRSIPCQAAADRLEEMAGEIERLRDELDEAQLRDIAARNPGIDIEAVREFRRTGVLP